jgi:hypothetical protein
MLEAQEENRKRIEAEVLQRENLKKLEEERKVREQNEMKIRDA